MARATRDTARIILRTTYGYEVRAVELGEQTVQWETFREDRDATPAFQGLPGDSCACPHWGLVLAGRLTLHYGGEFEVFEAGDAWYAPPGHVPIVVAGTELVSFSPTAALREVNAALAKKLAPTP